MNLKISINENYIAAFFSLMLFFMYLGRALFYIHFLLIFVLFLIFCLKKSFEKFKITPFFSSIIIYFIITILINIVPTKFSNLNNIQTNISVALMTIITCYFSEYLFFNSDNSKINRSYALKYFFYSTSILSILIILSFVFDINIVQSISKFKTISFIDWMYHSLQNFLSLGFCFLLYYFFKNRSSLNAILILFFLLATLASHGRTAIITTTVSGIVYLYIANSGKRNFILALMLVVFSITAVISVTYISSGHPFRIMEINTSDRLAGGIKYINYVLDNSPYWGLGLDGAEFLREIGVIRYGSPHNIFLDAFVSMGFFGLGVFTGLVVFLSYKIRLLFLSNPDPHQRAVLVAALLALLVDGQAFLSIWAKPNMALMFFYLFLAIGIARIRPGESASSGQSTVEQLASQQ